MALNHLDKRSRDERVTWEETLERGTRGQILKVFLTRLTLDLSIEGVSKDRLRKIYDNPKIVLPAIEAILRGHHNIK